MDFFTCYGSVFPKFFAVGALAYALGVAYGFWTKKLFVSDSDQAVLTGWGKLHVVVWTIGPPTYFFVEYWAAFTFFCPGDTQALANIKLWQDFAIKFWAGILAAILFLKGK